MTANAMEKPAVEMAEMLTDLANAMKSYLVWFPRRRRVFDSYYRSLKMVLREQVERANEMGEGTSFRPSAPMSESPMGEITPDDALLLLVQHVFFGPVLLAIMGEEKDGFKAMACNPLVKLLEDTCAELRLSPERPEDAFHALMASRHRQNLTIRQERRFFRIDGGLRSEYGARGNGTNFSDV